MAITPLEVQQRQEEPYEHPYEMPLVAGASVERRPTDSTTAGEWRWTPDPAEAEALGGDVPLASASTQLDQLIRAFAWAGKFGH
jgi:hypothetical protein